jgi:hypothetical protein
VSRPLLIAIALAACKGPEPLAVWADDPSADPDAGSVAVLVVPNHDDDDQDGVADWEQLGVAAGDDDFAWVELSNRARATTLRLRDAQDRVRVYHEGRLVLGAGGPPAWNLPDRNKADTVRVRVEVAAAGPLGALELVDAKKEVAFALPIVGSYPAVAHHLLPTERLWVVAVREMGYSNATMIDALTDGLGGAIDPLSGPLYGYDVWVQDEPEITRAWSPTSEYTLVLNSIRDGNGFGGLDPFPSSLVEPDVFERTIGSGGREATTYDAFGNLEASPPVEVDGIAYPMGRIYYGWNGDSDHAGPIAQLRAHLDTIAPQKPFWIDTTWLCVGHIDEVTSFVPDPTAPRGFRFLISDTNLGFEAINAVPGDTRLTNHGRGGYDGHGRPFASAYQNDAALRAYNQDIQRDHLEPTLEVFRRELALTNDEIVRVPSYFEEIADSGFVCGAAAIVPGMVNLLMETDETGTGGRAWIADPFFRPPDAPQSADPFIQMWNDLLPATVQPVYIDNWTVYHMGLGEVHCATNQERRPALSAVPDLSAWLAEVTR